MLRFTPQEHDLKVIEDTLAKKGIAISQTRVALLLASPDVKASALSAIERAGGVRQFADRLLEAVNKRADDARFRSGYRLAVSSPQEGSAEILCEALVFLGALWGVGCAATGGACFPCCIAAALLLAFAAFLDLVGFC